MAGNSSSKNDDPIHVKCLCPEDFLSHARDLVAFEHGSKSRELSSKKVSSLVDLAVDGLFDQVDAFEEDELETSNLIKLLPKET